MISFGKFLTEKISKELASKGKLVPKRKLTVVGPTVADLAKGNNPALNAYARKQGIHHAGWGIYENKEGKPVAYSDPDSNHKFREYKKEPYTKHPIDRHIENHFQKIESHAQKVHRAFSDFRPDLDKEEERSVSHYTGSGYDGINSALYKGTRPYEEDHAHIENLKNAIDNNRAPFDYTTYTGLSRRYKPENIRKGKKYIFHGFLSSSLSPEAAGQFISESGHSEKDAPIMIQLHVKKGQKAMYVGHNSRYDHELETIMPPKTRIHIVSGPHKLSDVHSVKNIGKEPRNFEEGNNWLNASREKGPNTHYYVAKIHDEPDEDAEDVKSTEDKEHDILSTPLSPGSRKPEHKAASMSTAVKFYHGIPDKYDGNRDFSYVPEKTPKTENGNIVRPKKKKKEYHHYNDDLDLETPWDPYTMGAEPDHEEIYKKLKALNQSDKGK